ncbi:MAG: alanyl-tRNA editing protein [bacterium]
MTKKLYYLDSHLKSFPAQVLSCVPDGDTWLVTLNETAFFPEGGGQEADRGTLGGAAVLDVQETPAGILHRVSAPLSPGETVTGVLDWARRFRNMQSHSGEHIVSGLVHNRFGYENVGFHMGAEGIIVDFSGFLTQEKLRELEWEANRVIWADLPITTSIPSPAALAAMSYRSKKELTGEVRIVTIEGVDKCACCAPHVNRTGEVGLIRILESIRRRDGVRIRMLAGENALADTLRRTGAAETVSHLLSTKPEEIGPAVERVLAEREKAQYALGGLKRELIRLLVDTATSPLFFRPDFSADELRILANAALERFPALVACFAGSNAAGYQFILASRTQNLRALSPTLLPRLKARGGGQPGMLQGRSAATEAELREALEA